MMMIFTMRKGLFAACKLNFVLIDCRETSAVSARLWFAAYIFPMRPFTRCSNVRPVQFRSCEQAWRRLNKNARNVISVECRWWCAASGTVENSTTTTTTTTTTSTTTTDGVAAAFGYETMNSFRRFKSRVRLQQTSAAADISDSYSVSAACKQHPLTRHN